MTIEKVNPPAPTTDVIVKENLAEKERGVQEAAEKRRMGEGRKRAPGERPTERVRREEEGRAAPKEENCWRKRLFGLRQKERGLPGGFGREKERERVGT